MLYKKFGDFFANTWKIKSSSFSEYICEIKGQSRAEKKEGGEGGWCKSRKESNKWKRVGGGQKKTDS